ncbi:hypothetical protein EDD86DRAFT_199305 [Gorgonomyces haynaldii]|nr:hypothetical protein EDD86DRAFT_199305 [Gorgonomyces haynaldii]
MFETNKKYVEECKHAAQVITGLRQECENMSRDLANKNELIAKLRQKESTDTRFNRSHEEAERLLLEETKSRIKAQEITAQHVEWLRQVRAEFQAYKDSVQHEETQRELKEKLIVDQKQEIEDLKRQIIDLNFTIDELQVTSTKFQRRHEDLLKNFNNLTLKANQLEISEATLREENAKLQKRLKEFIDANKELTGNYQIVKKNYDIKKHEIDELTLEIEEAKNACQALLKQKKVLQLDLSATSKLKNDLQEKQKSLEAALARKERDISDLLNKLNETIGDYELKLERKDEQIWQMTIQMNEEVQKSQMAAQPKTPEKKQYDLDATVITDLEKKYEAREKMLVLDKERLLNDLRIRDEKMQVLQEQVAELQRKQFQPRMERLKIIEKDVRNRILEYSLAEERMENGFLCPKDLQFFKSPVTLSPCGHTFCSECANDMQQENYNVLKCEVCSTVADTRFKNEQIEMLTEQFKKRKHLTQSFLEWMKTLSVSLPPDGSRE